MFISLVSRLSRETGLTTRLQASGGWLTSIKHDGLIMNKEGTSDQEYVHIGIFMITILCT